MGYSKEARRHAATARSIRTLLGENAYLTYKRSGNFNASALEAARAKRTRKTPEKGVPSVPKTTKIIRGNDLPEADHKPPFAKLEGKHLQAVNDYASAKWVPLNKALRLGIRPPNPDMMNDLDGAIEQQPKTENVIKTYRGFDWRNLPSELSRQLEVGKVFADPAYLSTSTTEEVASGRFAWKYGKNAANFTIEIPPDSKVLDVESVLGRAHEREILLTRGAHLEVLEADRDNHQFTLRLLPEPPVAETYSFTGTDSMLSLEEQQISHELLRSSKPLAIIQAQPRVSILPSHEWSRSSIRKQITT